MDINIIHSKRWLDAQYSVLGSVLICPEVAPQVIHGTSEQDYTGACQTVFKAIKKLFSDKKTIDPVSVNSSLGGEYHDFILDLMEITPTAANVDTYIQVCREQSQMGRLRELAGQMAETTDPDVLRNLFSQATSLTVTKNRVRITTMSDAMREFMEDQQKPTNYLSWPIRELNGILYAEPGDFIVIGGYPSSGKTAFALQCMWHFERKQKVGFFSLETTAKKLFARQVAAVASIPMQDIKGHTLNQQAWDKLCAMSQKIVKKNVELVDASGYTVDDIQAVTMTRGYKVIFVDYLQLIQASGISRVEQVTAISIALHTMAQSLGVTVVALSQLSRNPKDQRNKLPDMSSLRESGQIEQDADVILLLSLKDNNDRDGQRVLQVAKNKEGTRPDMVLNFDGQHQAFSKATFLDQAVYDAEKIKGKKSKKKTESGHDDETGSVPGQMEMLPENTEVPFHD